MDTTTQPAVVPQQLTQWRPGCDMFGGYEPPCGSAADYGLVTHGGCSVRLTCSPCYKRFLAVFLEWLGEKPESNTVACHACGTYIDNPWGALHLEPL